MSACVVRKVTAAPWHLYSPTEPPPETLSTGTGLAKLVRNAFRVRSAHITRWTILRSAENAVSI